MGIFQQQDEFENLLRKSVRQEKPAFWAQLSNKRVSFGNYKFWGGPAMFNPDLGAGFSSSPKIGALFGITIVMD